MKKILLSLILFYRKHISPALPPSCRFLPTCSDYAMQAITKYGAAKGSWLAIKRVAKCHPFYKGDLYDPLL